MKRLPSVLLKSVEAQGGAKCPFLADGCHGHECMMWRQWSNDDDVDDSLGYCGLAGRPQAEGGDA